MTKPLKKPSKKKIAAKPLMKTFRGAEVVRGLGMLEEEFDDLVLRKSLDEFDATGELWLVIRDKSLQDPDDSSEVRVFRLKEDAVRYAQACANGNVDQRVLRVTDQVLVIATHNEL